MHIRRSKDGPVLMGAEVIDRCVYDGCLKPGHASPHLALRSHRSFAAPTGALGNARGEHRLVSFVTGRNLRAGSKLLHLRQSG